MTETVRAHLWVRGRVQGVSFRAFTQGRARVHSLHGGVRNLDDGRVEAVLEGPRAAVEAVIADLQVGPPRARVDEVEALWEPPTGAEADFRIWH